MFSYEDHMERRIVGLRERGLHDQAEAALLSVRRYLAAKNPRLDDSPERKQLRKEYNFLKKAKEMEKQLPYMDYQTRRKAEAHIKDVRSTLR